MNRSGPITTVTVIIPTCDRPESLAACLASIRRQTFQPQEVIVVNDGVSEVVADGVRIVKTAGRQGPATARSLGVEVAKTELVAFIDDDCQARADWLEQLVKVIQGNVGFGFGTTVYRADGYHGHLPERVVDNHGGQYPGGANLIFNREVFERLGGFNSRAMGRQHEDTELAIRAVSRGVSYVRSPEAVVYHQADRWTVSALLASAKNLAVWVWLKDEYPKHFATFGTPVRGRVVAPSDYLVLLAMVLIVPGVLLLLLMLARYWWLGGRDMKIFFAKWPVWFVLRRWWVWQAAWRQRVFMV